jgi:predicted SnoaL-like aldol condensation-catalyzing enzyme
LKSYLRYWNEQFWRNPRVDVVVVAVVEDGQAVEEELGHEEDGVEHHQHHEQPKRRDSTMFKLLSCSTNCLIDWVLLKKGNDSLVSQSFVIVL